MQQAQQQVLGTDDIALVQLGLQVRDLQDLLGLLRKGDIPNGEGSPRASDRILNCLLQFRQIAAKVAQDFDGDTFALANDPQKQMLRPDVVMAQPDSLLSAKRDHISDPVGEVTFHS